MTDYTKKNEIDKTYDLYLIFGFISSLLGLLGSSYFGVGLPFSFVGIVLSDLSRLKTSKINKASIIISIIGLVINVISFIIYLTILLYPNSGPQTILSLR